jgi:hypothetical protein
MKWASLPLLALVLSLPSSDRAASQTLSPREQIRQRVNDNVLFLMGGATRRHLQPACPRHFRGGGGRK